MRRSIRMDRFARRLGDGLRATTDGVPPALERVAFWSAIALPCLHLPLVAAVGVDRATAPLLACLWALHAVALAAGADYDPRGDGLPGDQ